MLEPGLVIILFLRPMFSYFLVIIITFGILWWTSKQKDGGIIKKVLVVILSGVTLSSMLPLSINGVNFGILHQVIKASVFNIIVLAAYLSAVLALVKNSKINAVILSAFLVIVGIISAFLSAYYGPMSSMANIPFVNPESETAFITWMILYLAIPFVSLIGYVMLAFSTSKSLKSQLSKYIK